MVWSADHRQNDRRDADAPNADLAASALSVAEAFAQRPGGLVIIRLLPQPPTADPTAKARGVWDFSAGAGVSSLRRVLQRHRPGPGTVAEGQSRPADIVAFAPFDHTVDDAALDLPPESVGREAKLLSDQLRLNDEAIL